MKDNKTSNSRIEIALAAEQDRNIIYRLRHEVYACELGQHQKNSANALQDAMDDHNIYIIAKSGKDVIGFISVTPPSDKGYSIDKYFSRPNLPIIFDDKLYEVRLLTVVEPYRGYKIAGLLMYAALRWIEERGGEQIVAIGRREILDLYLKIGLKPLGYKVRSGAVDFELLTEKVSTLNNRVKRYEKGLRDIQDEINWQLTAPFNKKKACFHGGAFFKAIGEEFDNLEKSKVIINADVLDAWYPPSPKVIMALQEYLPWLSRTSPPLSCEGMVKVIARTREIDPENILTGAGSSDLIFLAFRQWLNPNSRVLLLDPSYGEYGYICEQVIGCKVDRLILSPDNDYSLDPSVLEAHFKNSYDLIVLINPNNPTGRLVSREALEKALNNVPLTTKVWIDEAYIEYAGAGHSLEYFAAKSSNIIVCKSMSKCYALSGMRAAYLCGPYRLIEELRRITPPWAVSLPAQVAAVMALQDPEYYAKRYTETHRFRDQLIEQLKSIKGMHVVPSLGNFILCRLSSDSPCAADLISKCKKYDLFLRDVSSMSTRPDKYSFRIAVKDVDTNTRMVKIIRDVLDEHTEE
jgi:histidinol-phosphate/aromatic aminotransferase/cobyric acid decarboxylase-like protein/GNAT superfamily N-acetyltransferase